MVNKCRHSRHSEPIFPAQSYCRFPDYCPDIIRFLSAVSTTLNMKSAPNDSFTIVNSEYDIKANGAFAAGHANLGESPSLAAGALHLYQKHFASGPLK